MTQRQQKALAALLTQPTREEAAAKAGITSKTLREYLKDPEFAAEYKRAAASLVDEAARVARVTMSPALVVLNEIARDPDETSTARIQACRSLLEFGLRIVEINDILSELEGQEG